MWAALPHAPADGMCRPKLPPGRCCLCSARCRVRDSAYPQDDARTKHFPPSGSRLASRVSCLLLSAFWQRLAGPRRWPGAAVCERGTQQCQPSPLGGTMRTASTPVLAGSRSARWMVLLSPPVRAGFCEQRYHTATDVNCQAFLQRFYMRSKRICGIVEPRRSFGIGSDEVI